MLKYQEETMYSGISEPILYKQEGNIGYRFSYHSRKSEVSSYKILFSERLQLERMHLLKLEMSGSPIFTGLIVPGECSRVTAIVKWFREYILLRNYFPEKVTKFFCGMITSSPPHQTLYCDVSPQQLKAPFQKFTCMCNCIYIYILLNFVMNTVKEIWYRI